MNRNELMPYAEKAYHANSLLRKIDFTLATSADTSATNLHGVNYENGFIKFDQITFSGNSTLFFEGSNLQFLIPPHSQESRVVDAASFTKVLRPYDEVKVAAFEELAKVRADDRVFLNLVSSLRSSELIPENTALAERLISLLHAFQEDYGESLDAESLRSFISFLSDHPELKRPIITATPDGNLFAEWKGEKGRHYLGLQFLPTRHVRYVAVRQNPKYAQDRIRSSGVVTIDQLIDEIASHNVTVWAGRTN